MGENKAKLFPQFCAGYAGAMGGFNTGITLGWASGGLVFIKEMRGKSSFLDPWISSVLNLGACISIVLGAALMDRIGRKWTMIMVLPVFLAVWLILAFVRNEPAYIVMRVIMGITCGLYCVIGPVYAGEIADKFVRGSMGVSYQLCITLGILYTYCMSLVPTFLIFNLVNIIPLFIFFVWIIFMPETPYFLISVNKEEQAKKSLQWLRGKNYNIDAEYAEIRATVTKGKEMKTASLKELSTKLPLKRGMWIGCLLMMCQQLSGINVVIFNVETIFKMASQGEEMMDSKLQGIIIGVVQVVMTLVAAATVDHFGRRKLMMFSMLLMCIFQAILFVFFLIKERQGESMAKQIAWLPIVCVALYIAGFSLGAGPVPWALIGEIFSEESKSIASSIVAIFNWLLSFIVTWVFEYLKNYISQWIFFLVFACLCFLGLCGVFFFMVETKDRTFQEIQAILEGRDTVHAPICYKRAVDD